MAKQARSLIKTSFSYAYFNDYIEFYRFQLSIPIPERHFHEVILQTSQKPHFDIDISYSKVPPLESLESLFQQTLDALIDAIIETFNSVSISLNLSQDILIFTSHSVLKKSCHIILPNHYHLNNKDAKFLFDILIEKIPPNIQPLIDASVYSSTQNFRMLHSSKFEDTPRVKTFQPRWSHRDTTISYSFPEDPGDTELFIFYSSLISMTHNSKLIPFHSSQPQTIIEPIPEKFINDIILACSNHISPFPFKFRSTNQNFINLDRLKPSYCSSCKTIHDKENPFISLSNRKIYFHCRKGLSILIPT